MNRIRTRPSSLSGLDADRAVGPLPRARLLEAAVARDRRREHAVANDPRRVAPVPGRQPERVGPRRA